MNPTSPNEVKPCTIEVAEGDLVVIVKKSGQARIMVGADSGPVQLGLAQRFDLSLDVSSTIPSSSIVFASHPQVTEAVARNLQLVRTIPWLKVEV